MSEKPIQHRAQVIEVDARKKAYISITLQTSNMELAKLLAMNLYRNVTITVDQPVIPEE